MRFFAFNSTSHNHNQVFVSSNRITNSEWLGLCFVSSYGLSSKLLIDKMLLGLVKEFDLSSLFQLDEIVCHPLCGNNSTQRTNLFSKISPFMNRLGSKRLATTAHRSLTVLVGQRVFLILNVGVSSVFRFRVSSFFNYRIFWGIERSLFWAISFRDPSIFVSNWCLRLSNLSMFSHRHQIRKTQHCLLNLFLSSFASLAGYVFEVSGKISVGGNSRTRTMHARVGLRSLGRVSINAVCGFGTINTVTGCLGVRLVLFF